MPPRDGAGRQPPGASRPQPSPGAKSNRKRYCHPEEAALPLRCQGAIVTGVSNYERLSPVAGREWG